MRFSPRAVAAAVPLVLVAGYAFVAVTYSIPDAPARSAVSSAFSPYFSQRWNVFAPNIAKSDRSVQVQVQWREDGNLTHSEWIDLTAIELNAVRGNPAPSRISKVSINASNAYISRFRELSDSGQNAAQDSFIERSSDGFSAIATTELLDMLDSDGDNRASAVRFLRYDYMLMRLSTVIGAAYFDKDPADIERVRWQITTQRVNDFPARFDEQLQHTAKVETFGWRQSTAKIDQQTLDFYVDMMDRYVTK